MFSTFKEFFKNQKGFTLIELLAVILILGIIGGIAVVAISGQGDKARLTSHDTNMSNLQSASERYDLERGLRFDATNSDYTVVDVTHPLITEGYLNEEIANPWADSNATQKDYKYIITSDERGVMYAYLAQVTGGTITNIVITNSDGEAEAVSVATSGITFVSDKATLDTPTKRLFRE